MRYLLAVLITLLPISALAAGNPACTSKVRYETLYFVDLDEAVREELPACDSSGRELPNESTYLVAGQNHKGETDFWVYDGCARFSENVRLFKVFVKKSATEYTELTRMCAEYITK